MTDKPKGHIPTLGEVLEPGHVRPDAAAPERDRNAATERDVPRSAFEVRIEAMIGEILKRHMEAAREEIVSKVREAIRGRKVPE